MAFYSSRVDEQGNELDRRHSARTSVTMPLPMMSDGSGRQHVSSRSCETNVVRFVNPAAFIEKHAEQCDQLDNNSNSLMPENRSDIVPPLDLQSEENYPTTRDYTFSYRKHCEAAKIVLKPDQAYETWLSAKRKLISDEAVRRKRAEEQKRKEQEERKRLSEEKFQQWLDTKAQQQTRSREKLSRPQEDVVVMEERPSKSSQMSEEEVQAKRDEWENAKRVEDERRRRLKRQQEQQQRAMEEQRRVMAAEAWERWLADAANKPKPVPLNRGIFTLRGTVSDIFVNPNEWQTADTTSKAEQHE